MVKALLAKPHGLILVTGPTGSGKTTTLYSALELIKSVHRNILTLAKDWGSHRHSRHNRASFAGVVCSLLRFTSCRHPADGTTVAASRQSIPFWQVMATMNEIAPSDKIQWLEQRHVELIEELDALNNRLEQALNSFAKQKMTKHPMTNDE